MKIYTKHFLSLLILGLSFTAQAQWTKTSIDTNDIILLKQVNGILFTYSYDINNPGGSFYRSADGGTNWQKIDSALFLNYRIYDVTYDSAHNEFAAVGTGQDGIFYSADGLSWTQSTASWNGDGIVYIDSELIISTGDVGVAISKDSGNAFTPSNAGLFGPFDDHYITRVNDTLYVSEQGTDPVMISTDTGKHWVNYSDTLNYFVNCFFEHQGTVYVGLYINGVAYHQDSNWVYNNQGLPVSNNINTFADAGDTLFCGGDSTGVWMNYDGTWQDFSCGLPSQTNVTKLVNTGSHLLVGTDNGIWSLDLQSPCIASGIADVQTASDLELYPTITDGPVSIHSSTLPQTITIVNLEGQVLEILSNTNTIDLSRYASGLYLVNIRMNESESVVRKVVKE